MGDLEQLRTQIPPCPAVSLPQFPYRFFSTGYVGSTAIDTGIGTGQRLAPPPIASPMRLALLPLLLVCLLSGCSFGQDEPTRTPVPTWTPTLAGQVPPAEVTVAEATATFPPPPTQIPPTATETPVETPTPLPTDTPAETPTPAPTDTPAATATPEPTATPAFAFTLEAAEKFPTDSLAANVVRVYLYVYSPATYGLAGYTLRVTHDGDLLTVEESSIGGVPIQTRNEPSPYTRFANMTVVFVEPQAGRWDIQLLDEAGTPVGPPATFELTADERTRELYVRYLQQ